MIGKNSGSIPKPINLFIWVGGKGGEGRGTEDTFLLLLPTVESSTFALLSVVRFCRMEARGSATGQAKAGPV